MLQERDIIAITIVVIAILRGVIAALIFGSFRHLRYSACTSCYETFQAMFITVINIESS